MKFYVTHRITARYISEVEADNVQEALTKSNEKFSEADFGEATDIDGEAVNVENESGKRLWEVDR